MATIRQPTNQHSRWRLSQLLLWVSLALAALLPRILWLGSFITSDEANFWMKRSEIFLGAIRTGQYEVTAISTHPGVTTMWLGAAGLLLEQLLKSWHVPIVSFAMHLAILQLPVALTNACAVLIGFVFLRRLLPPTAAILAAFCWALDPFVIGYSRLLHVDALLGSFATLSLLAACQSLYQKRLSLWMLSAIFGGLAILSKSPGLALFPIIAALLVVDWWQQKRTLRQFYHQAGRFLAWLLIVLLVIVALWPVLWVNPGQALALLRTGVEAEGMQPHMLGNYFLGQPDDAPGLLFYPLALVLRMTPLAVIGLVMLPLTWRQLQAHQRQTVLVLVLFVGVILVALSPFPKKFNRYIIPVMPGVDIATAVGLAWALAWLRERWLHSIRRWHMLELWLPISLMVATLLIWGRPAISYFNPLFGGLPTGVYTFSVGWGEGLSEAADWLNQQPDITGVQVLSTQTAQLQPYLRHGAQSVASLNGQIPPYAGYVVIYLRDAQGQLGPPFDSFFQSQTPVHIVTIQQVPFAWIYQVPPAYANARPASFGDQLRLLGYTLTLPQDNDQPLQFRSVWKNSSQPLQSVRLFAHLINSDGTIITQIDLPISPAEWGADRYRVLEAPIPLPAALPEGRYSLFVGIYDPNTGIRLPLHTTEPAEAVSDGPDALMLEPIQFP